MKTLPVSILRRFVAIAIVTGFSACTRLEHSSSQMCDGSASELVPGDLDAGPQDVTPADSPPLGDAGEPAPDPATWGCYLSRDCYVFPDLPWCDGNRCAPREMTVACSAGSARHYEGPEVQHTYVGSNGTFVDACDADGNLLDYECETELKCIGSPNPSCTYLDTGLVLATPTVVDCAGSCSGGHCDGRCPQQGDHVTFRAAEPDGTAQIHNDTDGRTYRCSLDYDLETDAFDCKTVAAGQAARVVSRSVDDNHCTGANFGGIGLTLDGVAVPGNVNESCAYQCGILPDQCKAR